MKRKSLLFIVVLLLSLLLFSCTEGNTRQNMEIFIKDSRSKTILPEGSSVDVVKFKIEGAGPNGSKVAFETSRTSYTLEGMVIGSWALTAHGLNREGVAIVEGSTTLNLTPANNKATIVLDTLVGKGELDLTFKWDSKKLNNPNLKLFLTDPLGTRSEIKPDKIDNATGSANIYRSNLASGSYTIQVELYDGQIKYSGFTEALRILDATTTQSTINMAINENPSAEGSITLINQAGVPVRCTITGLSATTKANKEVTASLSPTNASLNEISATWYLDGNKIGTGTKINFIPKLGSHRLDVVASTPKLGSSGSTYLLFEANALGQTGEPILNDLSFGKDINLEGKTDFEFTSDNKLFISSTSAQTLQLCSISNNTITADTTYDNQTAPIAVTDITNLYFINDINYLMVTSSKPHKVIALSYNANTNTLTKKLDNNSVLNEEMKFDGSNYTRPIYIPTLKKVISSCDISANDYEMRYGLSILDPFATNDKDFIYDWRNFELTRIINCTGYTSTPSGDNTIFLDNTFGYLGEVDFTFMGATNRIGVDTLTSEEEKLKDATAISFIDDTHLVIGKEDQLIMLEKHFPYPEDNYQRYWDFTSSIPNQDGNTPLIFLTNYKTGYLYSINKGSNNITTYKINGSTLTYCYTTPLNFIPTKARLSADGQLMMVQEEGTNRLTLFRILLR